MAPSVCPTRPASGRVGVRNHEPAVVLHRALVEDGGSLRELRAQPARRRDEPLVFGHGPALDLARRCLRLAEDEFGLAARLLLQLLGRLLRGDERRPEEALELAEADEVGLELLDFVRKIGALAPDVLETRDDLVEQPLGRVAAVAAEERPRRPQVSDLYRCECNGFSL